MKWEYPGVLGQMVINSNLSEEGPWEQSLKGVISETPDEFTKNALSMVYPPRIVKRILFRPYLGKLFPHIDVEVPNHRTQLSFFYGRINIRFSSERNCTICKTKLTENKNKLQHESKNYLPIYLCNRCKERVYHEYWDCLNSTVAQALKLTDNSRNLFNLEMEIEPNKVETHRCQNFLKPRCGFPIESSRTNPCLKNHGLALLMSNQRSLKLISAPIDKLKYMMMWEGGIAGIIVGYKRKILNLELLEKWLSKILKIIGEEIRSINQQSSIRNDLISVIFPQLNFNQPATAKETTNFKEWLLYTFLKYYDKYEFQKYYKILISTPIFILKEILEVITRKMEIDILEFINFLDRYPPLNFRFREDLGTNFKIALNIDRIDKFKTDLMDEFHYVIDDDRHGIHLKPPNKTFFTSFLNQFSPLELIKFPGKKLNEEIEIYKILGAFGKKIIVKSNQTAEPGILNLNEISGRYIF